MKYIRVHTHLYEQDIFSFIAHILNSLIFYALQKCYIVLIYTGFEFEHPLKRGHSIWCNAFWKV